MGDFLQIFNFCIDVAQLNCLLPRIHFHGIFCSYLNISLLYENILSLLICLMKKYFWCCLRRPKSFTIFSPNVSSLILYLIMNSALYLLIYFVAIFLYQMMSCSMTVTIHSRIKSSTKIACFKQTYHKSIMKRHVSHQPNWHALPFLQVSHSFLQVHGLLAHRCCSRDAFPSQDSF